MLRLENAKCRHTAHEGSLEVFALLSSWAKKNSLPAHTLLSLIILLTYGPNVMEKHEKLTVQDNGDRNHKPAAAISFLSAWCQDKL